MIYCVEDDAGIRNLMLYALNASGFETQGFDNGASMYKALCSKIPELILLDIMLPGDDGIAILKRLKAEAATRDIPVIMSTARGEEYDKVLALDMGADDYLAKPFGMLEMVSRVKAVLRRAGKQGTEVLRMGTLEIRTGEHKVCADGVNVELTLKEYELLNLMMSAPGRVFTREALLDAVWNEEFVGESRTVDVHIGTLRAKLGACAAYIKTVRGVGYRMEAEE